MSDDTELHADVARQIDQLAILRERPLIISDADEVIADFMTGFEAYLAHRDLYFTWREYRLDGHILRRSDNAAIENAAVGALIGDFFADRVDQLAPVEGAATAIDALSRRAQVVVLSNVPSTERARRLESSRFLSSRPAESVWPSIRIRLTFGLASRAAASSPREPSPRPVENQPNLSGARSAGMPALLVNVVGFVR